MKELDEVGDGKDLLAARDAGCHILISLSGADAIIKQREDDAARREAELWGEDDNG